jgi:ATP phosphoribosyltransferase regulatory subunit
MGLWLQEKDLPSRVCYADTILRHQDEEDISKNEFFQVGAELIGKAGSDADLEILLLLESIFEKLCIIPSIHMGSHQFLTTVLQGFSEKAQLKAMEHIRGRDFQALKELLSTGFSPHKTDMLISLFSFIGSRDEFKSRIEDFAGELYNEEMENLYYLIEIVDQMQKLGYGKEISIDLSEVGAQPYYTGIVFQVYLPGLDDSVASGGRYDKLLNQFGFDCPSVGFSIMLRKIEDQIDENFGKVGKIQHIEKASFVEAFAHAQELRKKGEIAVL